MSITNIINGAGRAIDVIGRVAALAPQAQQINVERRIPTTQRANAEASESARNFEPWRENKFLVAFPRFNLGYFSDTSFSPFAGTAIGRNSVTGAGLGYRTNLENYQESADFQHVRNMTDTLVSYVKSIQIQHRTADTTVDKINGHEIKYISRFKPNTSFSITYKDNEKMELLNLIEAWSRFEAMTGKHGIQCVIMKCKNNWEFEDTCFIATGVVPVITGSMYSLQYTNQPAGKADITVNFNCYDIRKAWFNNKQNNNNRILMQGLAVAGAIGMTSTSAIARYVAAQKLEPVNMRMLAHSIRTLSETLGQDLESSTGMRRQ